MSPHVPSGTETRYHPEARTVGAGFGGLSGRAVVVRVPDGAELGASVHAYRHAVLGGSAPSTGIALPPRRALRHPGVRCHVLRVAVPVAVADATASPERAVVREAVAEAVLRTAALRAVEPPRHLLDRHRTRTHGPDARYGRPASA
ncbi:hypothetical protein [Streptomyces sp. NPDC057854]|uniref:hypothetical protein n=1 Tax=unclassified Streptomyces TaxID=2593676 RepID=UPI0036B340DA